MSNDLTKTYAPQGDSRLRHQRARIEQRHLQFGRHCGLDIGGLMRAANRVQITLPAQIALEPHAVATGLTDDWTLGPTNRSQRDSADAARDHRRSPVRTPKCRHAPGPATLGDFVERSGAEYGLYREWVATLADLTIVVVSDQCGAPSEVGTKKAVSVVQSRAYLEHRARRLLLTFAGVAGGWQLVTIDLATKARRHGCEFLMSFAVEDVGDARSSTSPSIEIGFALPWPTVMDPVFVLTVVTAVGFAL
jgi:hypothetical protein